MTVDEFKALPVGTLVKIRHDDQDRWEVGEITKTGALESTVIWPESHITQYVGFTEAWSQLIGWLEVED